MAAVHPFLDTEGPIAFAHRGGTVAAPENTMAAFEHAVGLGYTHVETDVHVTSDGVLVAFHDDGLQRTCGVSGRIEDFTWDRLSALRVGGTDPIPRLADILTSWPTLRVNIDCKTGEAERELADTLRRENCLERVCLGSFNDSRLARFRSEFGPGLCTSAGPREVASLVLSSVTGFGRGRSGPAPAAQVPTRQGPVPVVTRRFVERCHAGGVLVHVWTVNDAPTMDSLLDLGVDGIMSDDTVLLREVMMRRGLWR